eukprot:Phypoly_transcript_00037.p1 GENE.Phypoly_transcript_00037~~Phypoly_transcript_00037.p1  ORF type:complete len:2892 (+),score=358.65 Phypoly_transcript_00037:827-8677(+)
MAFDYPTLALIWEYLKPLVAQKISEGESTKPHIDKGVTAPKTFGLTLGQKGLWWMWNVAPDGIAYNVANYFKFRLHDLDNDLLRACWNELGSLHDIMRTIFVVDPETGLPAHKILDDIQNPFSTFEVSDDAALRIAMEKEYRLPFDLSTGPLYRFSIFSNSDIHVILLVAHHIVTDAASEIFLVEDLFKVYNLRKTGMHVELHPSMHYSDFVSHSEQQLQKNGEQQWQYWKTNLNNGIPYLDFKFAKKSPVDSSKPVGASYDFYLGQDLLLQIKNVAKTLKITVYHVLLTGFMLLLYKYTNQKEIVIASFVDSRSKAEYERLLGFCVETILVKGDFYGELAVSDAIGQVSKTVIQATREVYPLPALMERLERVHGKSTVQVAFNFLQNVGDAIEGKSQYMPPLEPVSVIIPQQDSQFDLALEIDGTKDLFSVFKYNPQIFHSDQIETLGKHLGNILENICNNLFVPLSKIRFITDAEHELVVNNWNKSERDYPFLNMRAYDIIERQMHQVPENIAVLYKGESTTYTKLEGMVAQLADVLVSMGVGPNTTCGVFVERSLDLILAILAILKVGGTYLPLAHDYPASRVELILQDSQTQVLLTTGPIFSHFLTAVHGNESLKGHIAPRVIFLDEPLPDIGNIAAAEHPMASRKPSPEDIAYIIYTSGSTGTPKGVLIPNRGFSNLLLHMSDEYKLHSIDKVLMKSSITFDMSIFELFLSLVHGATVVIAEQGGQIDPYYLLELIQQTQITVALFVPGHIQTLFNNPDFDECTATIHTFIIGGEAVPLSLYSKLGKKLRNCYGPSEGTIWALELFCKNVNLNEMQYDSCRTIPAGKPIANSKIYILDTDMNPVPIGVAGELYISGVNVGLGYLNNPELTQQKFLPDPFHPPWKMYKTGDLGVYLPSGDIEILGRVDNQVKIRGVRVELGEITAALLRHVQVKEAITTVFADNDEKTLVAYITLHKPLEDAETNPFLAGIKQFLSSFLPAYMVPLHFVVLTAFPLTPSGKLNRSALPNPIVSKTEPILPPVASTSAIAIEETLRSMWAQLNVHVNNSLQNFADAGGSSLLAMQFLNKFKAVFNKKLPVAVFMKNPTIDGIAKYLTAQIPSRSNVSQQTHKSDNSKIDIAIVGMSCRYPGGDSLSHLWSSLLEGKDAIERAILLDSNGNRFSCEGGFITDLEKFDPKLFRLSPREASVMDPQQRLLLEVTWEALENAAIPPNSLKNSLTGVFIGAPPSGYFDLIRMGGDMESHFAHIPTGNFPSVTSGRIAHFFDLKGPAITIDTSCSSSLVAIHQACRSLLARETNIAITGGVNIIVYSELFNFMKQLGVQSDRCRTFDASAQGYTRSEGCGVVVLKRMADAIANNDPIVAVIKGSAINQDGSTTSISTPSSDAQVAVIEDALRAAQLSPNDITFLEAHGTGTPLGDPIEMEAIIQALCSKKRKKPLVVGSIKTNIGHAEAAAGVSGLIKVALALQNKTIPQHIHLKNLNPNMPDLEGKVVIPHASPTRCQGNHNAGVSSFGVSGTNAHIILATAPKSQEEPTLINHQAFIVPISGHTVTSLHNNVHRFKDYLQSCPPNLSSVSYTYMVGRAHLEHRLSFVGTMNEIEAGLDKYLEQKDANSAKFSKNNRQFCYFPNCTSTKVAFVFSEEDFSIRDKLVKLVYSEADLDEFVREAMDNVLIFKKSFAECISLYGKYIAPMFDKELAVFAFQYALTKTWRNWGVEPSACIGFGVGQYTAACLSGSLSLHDAISVLKARHQIIADELDLKSYAELIVYANESFIESLLQNSVAKIVSVNGLERVVVAGDRSVLRKLEFSLRASNIQFLFVDHPRVQSLVPFVSKKSHMEYQTLLKEVRISSPTIPMMPHMLLNTDIVRIDNITNELKTGSFALLEINSSSSISALLQRMHHSSPVAAVIPSFRSGLYSIHHALAKLYALGVPVDWNKYVKCSQRYENAQKIVLPNYAFDHVTCWFNDKPFRVVGAAAISKFEQEHAQVKAQQLRAERAELNQDLTPLLRKLHLPRPTFQANLKLFPHQNKAGCFVAPTSQVMGLVAQAFNYIKPTKLPNSPTQMLFSTFETVQFTSELCTVNIELTPTRDCFQFSVFLHCASQEKEAESWDMLTSGTAQFSALELESCTYGESELSNHLPCPFPYIAVLHASSDCTRIGAEVTLECNLSEHSFVHSFMRCCEDIIQSIHGNQYVAKVAQASAIQIHSIKSNQVLLHITIIQEEKLADRRAITLNVLVEDKADNNLVASGTGVVVGLYESIRTPKNPESSTEETSWTPTEKAIAIMWRQELMQPNLSIDDSFAELGGDSIFGSIICTQIERNLHARINVSTLLSASTVRAVAKLVDSQLLIGIGATEKGMSELVLMQQGTSRYPIFLIHPIGGTISIYNALVSRLGAKYTVYGLQAHGVHVGDVPLDDITEMAANYFKCIRSVQPHGPYHIGGSSFGGVVAYEIGQQLLKQGEALNSLVLFDSPCGHLDPLSDNEIFERSIQFIIREDFSLPDALAGAKLEQKLEYISSIEKLPKSLDIQALSQIVVVWLANYTALMKYTPVFYPGKMHLFKATVRNDLFPWVDVNAWQAEKLTVVEVPGDHLTMFSEPNVGTLAAKFLAILTF